MPASSPESSPSAARNLYVFGITSFLNDTASEMPYWVLPAFLHSVGSGYGLIQSMDSAGAIAGPLTALVLLTRYGTRGVFWGAAIPGALCVLVALFGIRETGRRAELRKKAGAQDAGLSLFGGPKLSGKFYFVLVAVTLFSLGNSSDMFLVMRAENIGIPVSLAPVLGLVFNITYTLGSWPAGWFSDRFSRRWIAAGGFLIFAGTYFVFGRAPAKLAIGFTLA